MDKKNRDLLYKLVNYYYNEAEDEFLSLSKLSLKFGASIGEIRTLINYFISCNFLYKKNSHIMIFKTKQNLDKNFTVSEHGNFYQFKGGNFTVALNKKEFNELNTNIDIKNITQIETLIYLLFLFTIEYFTNIAPLVYIKNNHLWYKKECFYKNSDEPVYMCEFTQYSDTIKFTE